MVNPPPYGQQPQYPLPPAPPPPPQPSAGLFRGQGPPPMISMALVAVALGGFVRMTRVFADERGTLKGIGFVSGLLLMTGLLLGAGGCFSIALGDREIPDIVRAGLLVAAGILLAAVVSNAG